tara:strand:- start:380 stop:595 length:216 start_codon:yes stop_codon:yes gene_type:complete
MADGRCFTIGTSAQLFNDHVMKTNDIPLQDNYSYRLLLQQKGPKILDVPPIARKGPCISCNKPLLIVKNTY